MGCGSIPLPKASRYAVGMDDAYHVTAFDNFHRGDPDESWVVGTFATAEAAIALVKQRVDQELQHFWSEIRDQDGSDSPLDRLISQYDSFAEIPIAFDRQGEQIFDTTAYMKSRAAEIVAEAKAQPPSRSFPR
jgi:hypothetical protein